MAEKLTKSMLTDLESMEESAIMEVVAELKIERDTFKRIAAIYQQGHEETKVQLQQFRDLLFATQAELQNERALNPLHADLAAAKSTRNDSKWLLDTDWASTEFTREHFGHVEKMLSKREYSRAVKAIELELRSPLSPEARFEGLLLYSAILRHSPSEEKLPAALTKSKEALELCSRHQGLFAVRPKANFYKGVCLYRLNKYPEARLAFASVGTHTFFGEKAIEYSERCKEDQALLVAADSYKMESRHEGKLSSITSEINKLKPDAPTVSLTSVEAKAHFFLKDSLQDSLNRHLGSGPDADIRTFLDPFDIPVGPRPSPPSANTRSADFPSGSQSVTSQDPPESYVLFQADDWLSGPASSAQSLSRRGPQSNAPSVPMERPTTPMNHGDSSSEVSPTVTVEHSPAPSSMSSLAQTPPQVEPAVEPRPVPNRFGRPALELDDGLVDYDDGEDTLSDFDYLAD